MTLPLDIANRIKQSVSRHRLLETARQLMELPSRTGEAGAVANQFATMLKADGFPAKRVEAGHPDAPAIVSFVESDVPGRTIQICGHLDTPHVPFVPPRYNNDHLIGTGASNMKPGLAAAVEALRAIREANVLKAGQIIFVVTDLHFPPHGQGQQLAEIIKAPLYGDAVLIPGPISDILPIAGPGVAEWQVTLSSTEDDVLTAGAELVLQLNQVNAQLAARIDPATGAESLTIGQLQAGNFAHVRPTSARIAGTRSWRPGSNVAILEQDLQQIVDTFAARHNLQCETTFRPIRDGFQLDTRHPAVTAFQSCHAMLSGAPLPTGAKPFVDDGNSFWNLAKVPAITHGPRGGGAYTPDEWVDINDLARVATLYAMTAVAYCMGA